MKRRQIVPKFPLIVSHINISLHWYLPKIKARLNICSGRSEARHENRAHRLIII